MEHNSIKNQEIKGNFVQREVYCNVNSLVQFCLEMAGEHSDGPVSFEDLENFYQYPEWSKKVLGENLLFEGGTEEKRETFLEEFDRLKEESQALLDNEEISEATHDRNLEIIEEARQEVKDLDAEPAEVYEWWAVSSWLYNKLKEQGEVVCDAGSCYIWGRQTSGQAILLDVVISRVCEDLEILEGQAHAWS